MHFFKHLREYLNFLTTSQCNIFLVRPSQMHLFYHLCLLLVVACFVCATNKKLSLCHKPLMKVIRNSNSLFGQ